jgi:hypothetical protein
MSPHPVGHRGDSGTAILEFLVVSVLLTVPLLYGFAALARIHQSSVIVESVADTVALGIARGSIAAADADRVARLAGWHAGLATPLQVSVRCGAGGCGRPGGTVGVAVTTTVDLPVLERIGAQRIEANHVEVVDRFGGTS